MVTIFDLAYPLFVSDMPVFRTSLFSVESSLLSDPYECYGTANDSGLPCGSGSHFPASSVAGTIGSYPPDTGGSLALRFGVRDGSSRKTDLNRSFCVQGKCSPIELL